MTKPIEKHTVKGIKSRKFLMFVVFSLSFFVLSALGMMNWPVLAGHIVIPSAYGYINVKQKGFITNILQPGAMIDVSPPEYERGFDD